MNIIDELRRRVVADLATAMKSPETPFTRGTIFAFELTLADIDSLAAAESPEPSITDLMATLEKSLASHRDVGTRPDLLSQHDYVDTAEDDDEAAMQARADAAMADRAFDALGVEG